MNIGINPEQIEKYIADQVLQSSIGDSVKTTIDEFINSKASSFDRKTIFQKAIEKEVEKHVLLILKDLISEKKDIIKASIEANLSEKLIDDIAYKCISSLIDVNTRN